MGMGLMSPGCCNCGGSAYGSCRSCSALAGTAITYSFVYGAGAGIVYTGTLTYGSYVQQSGVGIGSTVGWSSPWTPSTTPYPGYYRIILYAHGSTCGPVYEAAINSSGDPFPSVGGADYTMFCGGVSFTTPTVTCAPFSFTWNNSPCGGLSPTSSYCAGIQSGVLTQ